MVTIFRKSLLIFRRCRQLMIPYCLFLVAVVVHLVYLSNHFYQYHNIMATLKWAFHACVFGLGIFIYLGYEMGIKVKENNLLDTFRSMTNGYVRYAGGLIAVLFVLVLPYFVLYLGFFIALYFYSSVDYLPFLRQLGQCGLLYYGLSGLTCIFFGFFMSQYFGTRRFAIYTTTLVILFLNTNFTDPVFFIPYNLFYHAAPKLGQTMTDVLYELNNTFSLVPYMGGYGTTFAFDDYYGIPLEPIRWIWPCLFVTAAGLLIWLKNAIRTKTRLLAGSVLFGVALLIIWAFATRGSMLRLDLAGGYMGNDRHFYSRLQPIEHQEPGFTIESYDMDLKIRNDLTARVAVTLSDNSTDCESYIFTLYHGYRLDSIKMEDGQTVSYVRDNDIITIPSSEIGKKRTIVFEYSGFADKYYANRQAVSLPGYFPYYPMAGQRVIWRTEEQAINTQMPAYTADFQVKVDSDLLIYSNLAGTDNEFTENAHTVSLFAGLIKDIDNKYVASAVADWSVSPDDIDQAVLICEKISRALMIENPYTNNTTVFITPMNMMTSSRSEACAVLGDHILTYIADPEDMCQMIFGEIIPRKETNSALQNMFITYLVKTDKIRDKYGQSLSQPETYLNRLEQYVQMQTRERFGSQNETFYPALIYLCEQSPSKEEMALLLYQYLMSDSDQYYYDFLINLLKEDISHADN